MCRAGTSHGPPDEKRWGTGSQIAEEESMNQPLVSGMSAICSGALQRRLENQRVKSTDMGHKPAEEAGKQRQTRVGSGTGAEEFTELKNSSAGRELVLVEQQRAIEPTRDVRLVYCAGPLFNPAERETMEQIASALESRGFSTFLPHRDGLEFVKLAPQLEAKGFSQEEAGQCLLYAIDALDCYQVVARCGSLVFNAAGRVPDEGAVAEAAMAYLAGKPVVYFKYGDPRTKIAGVDNPLVRGRGGPETVHSIKDIPDALERRIAELSPAADYLFECSPHVWRQLEAGRRIWEMLVELNEAVMSDDERARRIAGEVSRVIRSLP
jgi:nucleoside 2-deoxyribosyltransferase